MRWLFGLALVALVGCDGGAECEDGAYQCAGDMLQICTDGAWVDDEDCAAVDMMCHAEMGHCMAEDTDAM